ncbi:hypothetical protein [Pseudoduganella chitinolytica]|uniref:TonB C-terminal domain-containing protein n=1 Tax=Pseudoduganella chitinolytica TaxID=34070 RepID=A0ABY8B7X2_9BURK|nr:hypothetical protein [Pseudoduganella chitinolytica]WEF32026.1 hypothetical protein PX653_21745 [Pseudoduganella chitinolytica]
MRTDVTVAVALLLLVIGSAPAQQAYKLKEEAPTGSHLRRDAAAGYLPFDKTYEQLTAAEKARLLAHYEHMAPGDEPPYPKHGLKRLIRTVGQLQGRAHLQGKFDAGVVVGPDGKAIEVRIYESATPEMTQLLSNLLVVEQYKPALCRGRPCTQEFPFRIALKYRP